MTSIKEKNLDYQLPRAALQVAISHQEQSDEWVSKIPFKESNIALINFRLYGMLPKKSDQGGQATSNRTTRVKKEEQKRELSSS